MDLFSNIEQIPETEENGAILNNILLPDEIITLMLSFVQAKSILNCKLVCKKWNEVIKSNHYWRLKLRNKITKKKLPWYVHYCYSRNNIFEKNLLKNSNGEKKFKYWNIISSGGNEWVVEKTPLGADPLPENQLEFNGHKSCFATSFSLCSKSQAINFEKNKLMRHILNEFQPKIYVSEWFAGRFDCGCRYTLSLRLYNSDKKLIYEKSEERRVLQWEGSAWSKIEIVGENYGKGVTLIEFQHEGSDTQYWSGHYGSKMAGGVLKILFDDC